MVATSIPPAPEATRIDAGRLSDGRPAPVTADDLPDTALFWRWVGRAVRPWTGWILVGLGAIAILIGYLGVSREALVAKQIPYIVSGGILGLALVAIGTFYLVTEELRSDSGRLDRLERMVAELHTVLLTRGDAPTAEFISEALSAADGGARRNGRAAASGGSATLVALPESQRYHRAECRMVDGKPMVATISASDIRRRGLQPCGMCEPQTALRN